MLAELSVAKASQDCLSRFHAVTRKWGESDMAPADLQRALANLEAETLRGFDRETAAHGGAAKGGRAALEEGLRERICEVASSCAARAVDVARREDEADRLQLTRLLGEGRRLGGGGSTSGLPGALSGARAVYDAMASRPSSVGGGDGGRHHYCRSPGVLAAAAELLDFAEWCLAQEGGACLVEAALQERVRELEEQVGAADQALRASEEERCRGLEDLGRRHQEELELRVRQARDPLAEENEALRAGALRHTSEMAELRGELETANGALQELRESLAEAADTSAAAAADDEGARSQQALELAQRCETLTKLNSELTEQLQRSEQSFLSDLQEARQHAEHAIDEARRRSQADVEEALAEARRHEKEAETIRASLHSATQESQKMVARMSAQLECALAESSRYQGQLRRRRTETARRARSPSTSSTPATSSTGGSSARSPRSATRSCWTLRRSGPSSSARWRRAA